MRVRSILTVLFLAAVTVLAGCVTPASDGGPDAASSGEASLDGSSWAKPLPQTITGLEFLANAADVKAGAGIWMEGDHAYVSGLNSGFHVVNVSTPEAPVVVGHVADIYSRDVDLLHYEDGRTVAVLATGSRTMTFVDVTDPEAPAIVGEIELGGSTHNIAVLPGTHYVYNSRSVVVGPEQGADIVDASDPANPQLAAFADNVLTCHDVTFFVSEEKTRGYCAGVVATEIWDLADPVNPKVVTQIANPLVNIHHWAKPTPDGKTLIIGDEHAGAAANGCGVHAETPLRDVSDTVGAVWFYDISDETAPVPQSWLSVQQPVDNFSPGACTAHFGGFVGDRDMMVVGWYIAGVTLIDFSDRTNPKLVDQWYTDGNSWDAWVHNGYVFSGDTRNGLDVLTFVGEGSEA